MRYNQKQFNDGDVQQYTMFNHHQYLGAQ